MTVFSASYLEIESRELVRHLLRETAQHERDSTNPADLLDYLKLEYLSFDFERELPPEAKDTTSNARPRALISFNDRVVATDESLIDVRAKYCVLHEIAHYVLPHHEHTFYICDDIGMSFATRLVFEKEANEFAADLLFLGDRFSVEVNSHEITAATVKHIARKYSASFEATARRLVEKNFRPCMLVVFKEDTSKARVDTDIGPTWCVRYCVASPTFKNRFFERIKGVVPHDIADLVTQPGRDIAASETRQMSIPVPEEDDGTQFQAEFFCNSYNVFCLLTPT